MAKKKPKIVFADQTVVESLQPYVDQVLDAIAVVLEQPGARDAFVSDMSAIWCFLPSVETGEVREMKDPLDRSRKRKVKVVTVDTPENAASLKQISERLGVAVSKDDYIYEVALRLRDQSS